MKPGRPKAGGAAERRAEYGPSVRDRLDGLVTMLGNNRVAELLGCNRSQPSRWRRERERMSPDARRRVLELDHIMTRLLEIMPLDLALIWLESPNAHIGGTPLGAWRRKGTAPVIYAIECEEAGVYV